MPTCPDCGAPTTAGAACVACGAAPDGGDPGGSDRADEDHDMDEYDHDHAADTATLPPAPGAGEVTVVPPPAGAIPVTEESRNWALVAHLSGLVSAGLGGLIFLGPLLVWLLKKDDDPFVAHHAAEALNFNLSMTAYSVLAILAGLTIIGLVVAIPAFVVGAVIWFVTSIVAAIRANRGESYRYPLTIRFVRG